jgi:hypothetical protein
MKNRNVHYRTTIPAILTALALTCLSSLTAQAASPAGKGGGGGTQGGSIVGLWEVHYFAGTEEVFQSYDQWHSDGLEFEVANLAPGAVCQGTWKQMASSIVQLFHVGWNFDANGATTGYFQETQTNTVSLDGNSYDGTYDTKDYDTAGNQLDELTGTLHATRLSVQ